MKTTYVVNCPLCSLRSETRYRRQAELDAADHHQMYKEHAAYVVRYSNGHRMPTLAELPAKEVPA